MSSQLVSVTVDTSALFRPATRSYGVVGIVGGAQVSHTDLDNPKKFIKQSDVETEYGSGSALALASALAFQNGAQEIWCVAAQMTAATQHTAAVDFDNTPDGTITEFTVTLKANHFRPVYGTLDIKVDSVQKVEGTDYTYDYGNNILTFVTAPGNGLAITMDFSYLEDEGTNDLDTALAKLSNKAINIVCLALCYDNTLLGKLRDHVNSASSSGYERIGVVMLPKGNTDGSLDGSNLITTTLASEERMVAVGSQSLNDVASAVAGVIAGVKPWVSLMFKPLSGVSQSIQFTTTEISALLALQVNPIYDPELVVGIGLYTREGYTLAGDASKQFVDIIRTIDDVVFRLKAGLTNPNTIGTLKINKQGLTTLEAQVRAIMGDRLKAGAIDSYDVVVPILPLASIPASQRTTEESAQLNAVKANRSVEVEVEMEYSGAMHYIAITLKFV